MAQEAMLRLPEVKRRSGLSRSTIYHLIDQGKFPRQVPLSARAVGWPESSISSWINDRLHGEAQ